MTAHELARLLLAGPDIAVMLSVDDQHGLLSPPEEPTEDRFGQSERFEMACLTRNGESCVVLSPRERA